MPCRPTNTCSSWICLHIHESRMTCQSGESSHELARSLKRIRQISGGPGHDHRSQMLPLQVCLDKYVASLTPGVPELQWWSCANVWFVSDLFYVIYSSLFWGAGSSQLSICTQEASFCHQILESIPDSWQPWISRFPLILLLKNPWKEAHCVKHSGVSHAVEHTLWIQVGTFKHME